jgi:PTS system mannose-specific IID component
LKIIILEALWNPRGQQSIGLLTVIDQALKIIFSGRPNDLKEARKRNIDFFNTNPIASGLVIGAVLRQEEKLDAGEITPDVNKEVIKALASALAAEGDQLFWDSWLPVCCLIGLLVTKLTGFIFAPLLIPVLFCAVAWPTRLWGVFKGYEVGDQIFMVYKHIHGEKLIQKLKWLCLVILSFLTALATFSIFTTTLSPVWLTTPWVLLSITALWFYRRVSYGRRAIISYLLYPVLLAILFCLTLFLI